MLFGKKRQSRDSALIQRVLALAEGKRLVLSPYSAPLFSQKAEILICPDPAREGKTGDLLFLEDTPFPEEGVETLILYKWNRRYPATRFFDFSLKGFALQESTDFAGTSHETITEEVWIRK